MASCIKRPFEFFMTTAAVIISTRYIVNKCIKKTTDQAKKICSNPPRTNNLTDREVTAVTNTKVREIGLRAAKFGEPSNR